VSGSSLIVVLVTFLLPSLELLIMGLSLLRDLPSTPPPPPTLKGQLAHASATLKVITTHRVATFCLLGVRLTPS
jgi:hypothetical protein